MKIVLFGATGMIGQGVLRALIEEPRVTRIEAIVRQPLSSTSPKVHSVIHGDFVDFSGVGDAFTDVDACCFALGVTSAGMSEAAYTAITYDVTAAAVDALHRESPDARFLFVSGASTDATEKGPVMWARVKGRAENVVRARFGRNGYVFRPGFIQPMDGIRSRTAIYNVLYSVLQIFVPLIRRLAPNATTTTRIMGRAMTRVALDGTDTQVLEAPDINRVGTAAN
jgi:uncharacterized protein YbjT (DUF2867 family)